MNAFADVVENSAEGFKDKCVEDKCVEKQAPFFAYCSVTCY